MSELRLPEINRVVLSGRLTRDPDRRYASDGTAITTLPLAFHRRYRTREGTTAEHTALGRRLSSSSTASSVSLSSPTRGMSACRTRSACGASTVS